MSSIGLQARTQAKPGAWPRLRAAVRAYHLWLLGALLLAMALRAVFWAMQSRSGAVLPGDSQEYVQGALSLLLRGEFITGEKWLRPPLYPLFLAVCFTLFGIDIARALLVQALLTAVCVLPFAALGRRLSGRPAVGVASALIAALYLPFAAYSSVLLAETLFILFQTTFFALALRAIDELHPRRRWWTAVLAGSMLGCAMLTRAVGLYFLPFVVLALVIDSRLRRPGGAPRRALRAELGLGLIVAGAAVLTIAPWTLHNYLVHQRFIPVDTNGGISFWYGTLRGPEELAQGEARLAQIPNLADKQRTALGWALHNIAADPAYYLLERVRYKVVSLWQLMSRNYAAVGIVSFDPQGHSLGVTPGELPLPLSLLADLQYIALVLGAIWGVCFAPRRGWSALLWLWVLFGTLLSAITIGHPRLRLPLLISFVPYAAWAGVLLPTIVARLRHQRRRALLALGLSLAFGALIYSHQYVRWASAHLIVWRGDAHDPATWLRAAQANPGNPLWLIGAADQAAAQGDWAAAAQLYAQASALEPGNLYAHARLLQAALLRGDPAAAQAEHNALRALGRDTNDLLRWAWARLDLPPPAVLQPATPAALGHIRGFTPTIAGDHERWSMQRAELRLQPRAACQHLALVLRGYRAQQPVHVEVAGQRVDLTLTTTPQTYTIPLAGGACQPGQPLIVTLRTPTQVVDVLRRPWPVGVAVVEARIQ